MPGPRRALARLVEPLGGFVVMLLAMIALGVATFVAMFAFVTFCDRV